MNNVIAAIHYSRINNIPTFGNCGGFQHMVIEFAKNVCNIADADHEETNPDAETSWIKKLSCSLKEQQENLTLLDRESYLYKTFKSDHLLGKYYCSYGVNENMFLYLKKTECVLHQNQKMAVTVLLKLQIILFLLVPCFSPV